MTRSICSLVYSPSLPVPGSPAFATNTSISAGFRSEAVCHGGVREVEGMRFDPLAQLRDELVQHLGPAPGQDQVRAAGVQRAGDRMTQAARGARQEDAAIRSARPA